jgi:hypothetical protein
MEALLQTSAMLPAAAAPRSRSINLQAIFALGTDVSAPDDGRLAAKLGPRSTVHTLTIDE